MRCQPTVGTMPIKMHRPLCASFVQLEVEALSADPLRGCTRLESCGWLGGPWTKLEPGVSRATDCMYKLESRLSVNPSQASVNVEIIYQRQVKTREIYSLSLSSLCRALSQRE